MFDYCASRCIRPARKNNPTQAVAACCTKKYYMLEDLDHPAFDLLKKERQRLYGKPEDQNRTDSVSPCEYHDAGTGCRLKTHKSPVCLAFLCRDGVEALRNEYGITAYDYLGAYYALEWILTGDLPDRQFYEFKESVCNMAVGWSKDGAVQDQIDASVKDAVKRARSRMAEGEGLAYCEQCEAPIPEARRKAVPGVRLCVYCQTKAEKGQAPFAGYNRRGSKDSQLK